MTPSLFHAFPWHPLFRKAAIIACLLTVLTFGAACGGESQDLPQANDFQLTTFDGETFRLSDQAGKNAVVLNFWYPSCPPCREEMPAFEEAWRLLEGQDVRFLGVFVPQGFDSEQDARDFVQETGLTYDFATDVGAKVALDYGLEYFPMTYFIDKSGRIFGEMIKALEAADITDMVHAMEQD